MTVSLGFESKRKSSSFIGKSPNLLYPLPNAEADNDYEFLLQIQTPVEGYTRILYVYYSCTLGFKVFRQQLQRTTATKHNGNTKFIEFYEYEDTFLNEKVSNVSNENISHDWAGEKYEKSNLFVREFKSFQKFILENPTQLLRYEWLGTPLLYSRLPLPDSYCSNCNSKRKFEFQLMPHLNSFILKQNLDLKQLLKEKEWITALVFTCGMDCDLSSDCITTQELVITQYDP